MQKFVIVLCFFCISFLSVSCTLYPELAENGKNAPTSARCLGCHTDIYNEWWESSHARSFTNPVFRETTNGYQYTFCLGCHAPETIFTDKIEFRTINSEEGVHCNSCHLYNGKLSGPTPAHGPHPVEGGNLFFKSSELCGQCHIGTFKMWQSSGPLNDKKTCQDCHMPSIKRKLVQDDPWQRMYPEREGKRHTFTFQHLSNSDDALLLVSFVKVIHHEGKIGGILEVENAGIPHSVPTGDYGYRKVAVRIELQDEEGNMMDVNEESMFVELRTALQYKEKRQVPFCFNWDGKVYAIKVMLVRTSFQGERDILLAEKTFNHFSLFNDTDVY
ncbi:MAG: cytochrome c family protein [Candidatus Brocadiaceae bacterium]|nr:cytochrome c family protein [Candidatus Brocadiaceae bacterium]